MLKFEILAAASKPPERTRPTKPRPLGRPATPTKAGPKSTPTPAAKPVQRPLIQPRRPTPPLPEGIVEAVRRAVRMRRGR